MRRFPQHYYDMSGNDYKYNGFMWALHIFFERMSITHKSSTCRDILKQKIVQVGPKVNNGFSLSENTNSDCPSYRNSRC